MRTAHLLEEEIQLYVAERGAMDEALKEHVGACKSCQVKIANYRLLFQTIQDEPKPKFDFDLATLVLAQLPEPKSSFPWAIAFIVGFSIILIASLLIFFWSPLAAIINSASTVLLITAVTGAAIILIFQAVEMFNNHNKRIQLLLKANTLQL